VQQDGQPYEDQAAKQKWMKEEHWTKPTSAWIMFRFGAF
jgi:hypothetical protein